MIQEPYEPLSQEVLEENAQQGRDLARASKARYDAYIEQGFTAEQSLRLVLNWQTSLLGGGG